MTLGAMYAAQSKELVKARQREYESLNPRERKALEIDSRVDEVAKGALEKVGDFFSSVVNGDSLAGKVVRSLLLGAVVSVAAFFLFSNPVGWIVFGCVATTALIAQLIIPTIKDSIEHDVGFGQMFAFKFSAWQRQMGFRGDNYNHVFTAENGTKIYLGALPNKNNGDLFRLVRDAGIETVISINEPWERENIGVSRPYTEDEYAEVGIDYKEHDVLDHKLLPFDEVLKISLEIETAIQDKRNVYVHCRAGVGRSAMGIAAYLIAVEHMTAEEAAYQIKYGKMSEESDRTAPGRKQSTIMKKLDDKSVDEPGLRTFAKARSDFVGEL